MPPEMAAEAKKRGFERERYERIVSDANQINECSHRTNLKCVVKFTAHIYSQSLPLPPQSCGLK